MRGSLTGTRLGTILGYSLVVMVMLLVLSLGAIALITLWRAAL